jgi:ribulose-phosphate 3-epimerase
MCADFMNLQETIRSLEAAKVEYMHVDIMDGKFVPNFTLGPDFITALRKATKIPMDIHLMIEQPGRHLGLFHIQPGDLVSIHQEACTHLQKTLRQIKERGGKAAVALNPGTPLCMIEEVLDDMDAVLLMTVNPGFAGQKLVSSTLGKISRLKAWLADRGYDHVEIEVDGNVSMENARKMRANGADIFVAGTSSIFQPDQDLLSKIRQLRQTIQ